MEAIMTQADRNYAGHVVPVKVKQSQVYCSKWREKVVKDVVQKTPLE